MAAKKKKKEVPLTVKGNVTVKELIAMLRQCPQDQVIACWDAFNQDTSWVPAEFVKVIKLGSHVGWGGMVALRIRDSVPDNEKS